MPNSSKQSSLRLPAVIVFGLICSLVYGLGAAIRGNIGILLNPLTRSTGLDYDSVSFCIAVMQLVFGASQPLFGILASRRSNREVLLSGIVLIAASMLGMKLSGSFPALFLSLGILFGLGAGAIAFGMILSSAVHFVGRKNAMVISGMLNAGAGMVSFFLAPLLQAVLDRAGLTSALLMLAALAAVLIPFIFLLTSHDKEAELEEETADAAQNENAEDAPKTAGLRKTGQGGPAALFRNAFGNRTYRLLIAGFSTCGFHMVIIESHLFSQFVLYGIPKDGASWAFSVYGVATIIGALLSGWLSTRLRKGRLLAFYYGFRAVWVLFYLLVLPKNLPTAVLFAVGLGMTGDATVSPTSGLVNEQFRLKDVATLVGFLFLCHQVGAFFSAWLGGKTRILFGDYTVIWAIDIALCLFAAYMSFRIDAKKQAA